MARNFAHRFNSRYSEMFPMPYPFNYGDSLIKVPSLDGAGKMSKSENINATLYLADDDDAIRKKVMKAKTDAGPTEHNSEMPDYIQNIFQLMHLVSKPEITDTYRSAYNNCTIRYGDMKKQLAEDMVAFIAPIREKAAELQKDEAQLQKILREGAEKARISASATIAEARKLIGINYY
jgi:tryptophanyl-tRNA synthetase